MVKITCSCGRCRRILNVPRDLVYGNYYLLAKGCRVSDQANLVVNKELSTATYEVYEYVSGIASLPEGQRQWVVYEEQGEG